MNEEFDRIEEKLKEERPKKKMKVSGRSVFKIQEIIHQKAQEVTENEKDHQE